MTEISEKLNVNRSYKRPYSLKSERTVYRTTFSPSTAKAGEVLYVEVPKLYENNVMVPESLGLLFNLEVAKGHINNSIVQNLARNLVCNLRITLGGTTIQDIGRYDLFKTYQDLYMSKEQRDNRLFEGISDLAFRKHRTYAGDKSTDVGDLALLSIYNKMFRIPLNCEILDSHGVFYPRGLNQELKIELTLANDSNIVITSDTTKNYKYQLNDIQLEYTVLNSEFLAREALSSYQMKGFYYEKVHHHKTFTISKPNTSIINEEINIPARSMKGLLLLFTQAYVAGSRDSELFINPNLTSVNINIHGMNSKRYNQGMVPTDFYQEALKRFGSSDNVSQKELYQNKHCLWIDLRTTFEDELHGNGLVVDKNGIKLEMKRKVGGVGDIICDVFCILDGMVEVENGNLKSVLY